MSDEHFTRAPPIECRLMSTSMEIDDDDEDVDEDDGLESNHFILSLSSALEGGAKGRPTMTTQRAKPLAKLIPSDIFAPTTQNRIAPLPS